MEFLKLACVSKLPELEKSESSVKAVDWSDFRDHIATAGRDGRRQWMYPRKVDGKFFCWRTRFSWLLLFVMFAGPFATVHGNPLLIVANTRLFPVLTRFTP